MSYQQLTRICGKAIKNNLCNGCCKLENSEFQGQAECELADNPIQKIKSILGIQEEIEIIK